MTNRVGTGQFLAWDSGCLFIGRHDRAVPHHAHQAIQFVAASEGEHRVRSNDAEPWQSYSIAAVPSRQPHSIDVTGSEYGIVLFLEPESREGRAIAQRYLRRGITEVGDEGRRAIKRAIFEAWLGGAQDDIVRNCRRLVDSLSAGIHPGAVTDERVDRAIAYINAHVDRSLSLEEVAEHICLSPSRFRHLFAEQTGMGLRPYILWRRFLRSWELIMRGATVSEAAHAAGFADAAHLSRTCTRTFGFAPSAMPLTMAIPDPSPGSAERAWSAEREGSADREASAVR